MSHAAGSAAEPATPPGTPGAVELVKRGGLLRPRRYAPAVELYVRSDARALLALVRIVALLLLAAASLPWLYARAPALLLVPFVVLGVQAYKLTIVLHDCSHWTMFSKRAHNDVAGTIAAGFLGSRLTAYRTAHLGHHKHCGTEQDTGDNDYLFLDGAGPARIIAHLLMPLTGYTFLAGVLSSFRANASAPDTPRPAASRHGDRSRMASLLIDLAAIVAVQAVVFALATSAGRLWILGAVYPVAGATVGLFLSRVRAFAEHVVHGREEGLCFVRTHRPNWFDSLFFYTLNMNYHVEHHLFPQVPSCNLPTVHEELVRAGFFRDERMVSSSILKTVYSTLTSARGTAATPPPRAHDRTPERTHAD